MLKLLKSGRYNAGKRPSEHEIGKTSFLKDNGGSIPPNVITVSNTGSSDAYQKYCKEMGIKPHPARMPSELAEFFIKFLTDPGDLVLDPFAGSNVTGAVAERLGRKWVAIERRGDYANASKSRFQECEMEYFK
jgi:site-specific DNA-methyltransferase (cytosine-N4-specific)